MCAAVTSYYVCEMYEFVQLHYVRDMYECVQLFLHIPPVKCTNLSSCLFILRL